MKEEVSQDKKLTIDSWEVEEGLRTLQRAEEIKQNSELMELISKKAALNKKVLDDLANRAEILFPKTKEK